jgi:hypothetical protein
MRGLRLLPDQQGTASGVAMREVPDPTGGWAKATEAAANASKEAIEAGRDLSRFISGPAGEVVGMLWDHLKVVRFERQVRLARRARKFLAERGMDGPTRTIALKIALPLLDNATLEEDDHLQDVWATLLVNSANADSGVEIQRAFVSVLAEMTALDVRNLAAIERVSPSDLSGASLGVWTSQLPDAAIPISRHEAGVYDKSPASDVLTSLSNLERLGCVYSSDQFERMSGSSPLRSVGLSPFGRAFVQACTYQRKP